MRSPKFKKLLNDKKAATAVAMAILFVPLLIAASAAVDFSRIASARTLLQASVDAAAVAGAGAYQTSQLNTAAQNVALATYSGTGLQLPQFVSSTTPTIGAYCSSQGSSTQCGTGSTDTGTLSGSCPSGWDANKEYCVVATASVTLKNSLFAWLIPSEVLSATAVATTAFPPLVIDQGDFSNTNIGYGSSLSGAYVYVVPTDSSGNPEYSTLPTPNTNCESSTNGPIANEQSYTTFATPATGVTTCNYLLIAENANGGVSGSLAIQNTDLIAFSFVNDLNERNASGGSSALDDTTYTSTTGVTTRGGTSPQPTSEGTATAYPLELYVTPSSSSPSPTGCTTTAKDGIYCAAGYNVPASANYKTVTTTTTCTTWNTNGTCKTTNTGTATTTYSSTSSSSTTGCTLNKTSCPSSTSTTVSTSATYFATTLAGTCPAHGLYGAIEDYYVSGTDIVPKQDSINTYSSAYEALGYPPTYATNNVLTPFLGPVTSVSATVATTTSGSTTAKTSTYTYSVQAICPQWPTTGTNISATGTGSFTPSGFGSATDQETVAIYGTYFPGATASDGVSGHVFPPPIAGCSPITSATSALPSASSSNPWWGWSPSNAITTDPNNTIVNASGTKVNSTDCTSSILNSGHTGIAYTTGTSAQQSASYNNCGLIIQPLGNSVPTNSSGSSRLPDYYGYVVDPTGYSSGKTGNPSGIIAMFPVFDEVTSGTRLSYSIPTPAALSSIADIIGTGISAAAGAAGYTVITVSNAPGYVPTGAPSVHANTTDGTYTVIEPPANGTDGNLPQDTSYQCYNAQANGFASGTYVGDNNNKTPIDPVANPQLGGSVQCGTSPPPSYGIYWNNLGTDVPEVNDDLGYGNAVTVFTCPTPSSTTGGGPSSLSG